MGTHQWQLYAAGDDLERVYTQLAAADRHEYGNDYYTGTIKNTHGVQAITSRTAHPGEANCLAGQLVDDQHLYTDVTGDNDYRNPAVNDRARRLRERIGPDTTGRRFYGGHFPVETLPLASKGGCAYAIPVGDPAAFTTKTRTVKVDVLTLGQVHADAQSAVVYAHLHDTLAAAGGSVRISGIELVADKPVHSAQISTGEGKPVTTYQVYRVGFGGRLDPVAHEPLPTMALARAKVAALLKRPPSSAFDAGNDRYEVLGKVSRPGGSALLTGSRQLTGRVLTLRVSTVTPKSDRIPVTGWQIYAATPE
jgi:hypothetical protein